MRQTRKRSPAFESGGRVWPALWQDKGKGHLQRSACAPTRRLRGFDNPGEPEEATVADTDIWPQINEALSKPGVVHRTPKHGRITIDFGLQDGSVTFASMRVIDERGRQGAQVEPPLVLSTSPGDEPDDALRWFLPELIQKAREALELQHGH